MLGNEKMSHLMKEYLNQVKVQYIFVQPSHIIIITYSQIKDTSSTEKKSSTKTETAP